MFRFKKFTIHQEHCAMKVTEVACIYAAWQPLATTHLRILDIGTGTGLISMMLAQRIHAQFTAIEIDKDAVNQAQQNVAQSPFNKQIHIIHADVKKIVFTQKFDLIVCNPPFFENQLRSNNTQKSIAWHSDFLTLAELFAVIKKTLKSTGKASLLLPIQRKDEFENLCSIYGFYIEEYLFIQPNEHSEIKYFTALFSTNLGAKNEKVLIVKQEGKYSTDMQELMKEYYLEK